MASSNYSLDASKMSRMLIIAQQDPSENELKTTALNLYRNLVKKEAQGYIKEFLEDLAAGFFRLMEKFARIHNNFYGMRDYYCLIKDFCNKMSRF